MTEWDTPPGLSNASICSQRPEAREVIYKLTANQQLGHFSPSEVLSEPPPMLATVFSRSTCDYTEVSLSNADRMGRPCLGPLPAVGDVRSLFSSQ